MITRFRHNICLTQATADQVAILAETEARSFSATADLLLKRGLAAYKAAKTQAGTTPKMDEAIQP